MPATHDLRLKSSPPHTSSPAAVWLRNVTNFAFMPFGVKCDICFDNNLFREELASGSSITTGAATTTGVAAPP